MNVDDNQQNGPDEGRPEPPSDEPRPEEPTTRPHPEEQADAPRQEEPTVETPRMEAPPAGGPQAPAGGDPEAAGGAAPPPSPRPGRRLTRSRRDRVIGGVCGGLGNYFNADPVLFRIGAVALTFLGGAGILLYLAALLLVPADDGDAAVTPRGEGRSRALVIAGVVVLALVAWPFLLGGGLLLAGLLVPLALLVGAGVVVWWLVSGEGPSGDPGDIARRAALGTGVLILCALLATGGAVAAAAGPDWVVAVLVIAAGAAILASAFLKPVRWLVLPAVAIALAAGTVAAAGIDLEGGVGDREYSPASAADIDDRYELGIGELVVDLRDTDLPAGDVPIDLDLGMGEARVLVPNDVCVAASADVGMGNVHFFGRDNGGLDVDFDERPEADRDTTRILVDAQVGAGELRVDDEAHFRSGGGIDFGEGRPFHDEGDDLDSDRIVNGACAPTGASARGRATGLARGRAAGLG
jgi:phage shock protein PspC (stress-responsive transcriptional regulator)